MGLIFSYNSYQELIDKISKISKTIRLQLPQIEQILDWRPEGKIFETPQEENSYLKKVLIAINKKVVRE